MKTPASSQSTVKHIGNLKTGHHFWIGKMNDGIEYVTGQTFKSTINGKLNCIKLYPEMIVGETDAFLSVFEFEEETHQWKKQVTENTIMLNPTQQGQWISFDTNNISMEAGKQYGFKISCNHGGIMAIAEGPLSEGVAYTDGEQWIGNSQNPGGKFYPHFDLAFIAEIQPA